MKNIKTLFNKKVKKEQKSLDELTRIMYNENQRKIEEYYKRGEKK